MKQNIGDEDKKLRLVFGVVLIILAMNLVGWLRLILAFLGAILIITGLIGFCLLYDILGVNTKNKKVDKLRKLK